MKYDFAAIEKKWQEKWEQEKPYAAVTGDKKPKFYGLIEFPYPSAAGLHVGHPRPFTAMDIICRKKRMQGYNVLNPIGFDAFGLPTENFAIKNHIHPAIVTKKNIENFTRQLKMLGYGFDWDRVIDTTDPNYYRWTQWIFLQMYKHGLAYKTTMPVNWCTSCKCVLANEEVVEGVCERCGAPVVRKEKSQWMLRITKYADRLADDLDLEGLDYIERVKTQQKNWIGRSTGTEVTFKTNTEDDITVYTTRVDTLFGVTYTVISPEHPLLNKWKDRIANWADVEAYKQAAARKSDFERGELNKDKTGVRLEGIEVTNPATGKAVPMFVSDYVLMSYGTGIVMGVPGHDQRDWDFATKFGLPIVEVVKGGDITKSAFTLKDDTGIMVNSGFLNGMTVKEAIPAMKQYAIEQGWGHEKVNYKLRDWVFSRQRYWGEPIPMISCPKCGWVPVPEDQLPVVLPQVESYEPTDDGESPLSKMTDWVNTTCPCCGGPAKRETDTMPQWAGSSWYYLRYMDPHDANAPVSKEAEAYWGPVDWYNGGMEHTTLHLLYSRFWHKFLYDQGVVPCKELDDVRIQYNPNWQTVELKDENGEYIYLYLHKGTNEIALEAIPGDIGPVMERLDDLIFQMNYYYRRILMITGPSPDEYNDYYLEDQIDGLFDFLQTAVDTLYAEKAGIESLTGQGSEASTLQTMAVILQMAIDHPEDLPQMLSSIKDQISAVSAWMRDYRDQPLEIDYIEVKSTHDNFRDSSTNFFSALAFGFQAFIGSFFEDYTSVSDSTGVEKTMNVWVSLGRDQATVVNELVSSEYNPNSDTKVSISLVQGAVLEATLAGKGPEVALFIGGDFPVVCASRGLLFNLKEQPGYDSVVSRFTPDVTTLYEFNGGVYGLPLTENFPMLFYRTDVLEELGYTEPPATWDDLINMLPDIQRKYLEVGLILPSNISSQVFDAGNTFVLLMLQTGQDFYNFDEASGQYVSTTFDTEAAVEAFTKWTKFYTVYDFDQTYDAFTRFRTGEMPMLLQNYAFYNQLSVAAPEIKGLWSFAHVPGSYVTDENGNKVKDENGNYKINYTANSGSSGAVIFTSCKDVGAAWNFIDWFTTTDVQVEYGKTIEAIMGPMGRYDTANVEALSRLNWSTSEYAKISDQMNNLREVPIIPASYAVTRNVYNAFRAVVNNQKNPRYQLSSYNRDINSEIVRKLKDLGYYNG